MSLFGLLLVAGGVGLLCWLLFTLAIYALPVFIGLLVAVPAFHSGAGYGGAFVVALLVGMAVFAGGKFAFANARTPAARAAIGILYTVPAAIAGYQASLGIARIGTPSHAWCVVVASLGAVAVGATAWCRLASLAPAQQNAALGPAAVKSTRTTGS